MKTQSADTSLEAEKAQIELLRKAGVAKRTSLALSLSQTVIAMAKRAIGRRHPDWSARQVNIAFVEYHYGRELADNLRQYLES